LLQKTVTIATSGGYFLCVRLSSIVNVKVPIRSVIRSDIASPPFGGYWLTAYRLCGACRFRPLWKQPHLF